MWSECINLGLPARSGNSNGNDNVPTCPEIVPLPDVLKQLKRTETTETPPIFPSQGGRTGRQRFERLVEAPEVVDGEVGSW